MKFDGKVFGNKMGAGYTFNEQVLFAEDSKELSRMTNTETLVACEESAFLKL